MRRYGLSWHEKQRRLPKLPGTNDRGAPLPAPNWANRWQHVNTAGRYEQPVIVRVAKPGPSS